MAKFTIYSPDGAALYTGTPSFTGQYMKPGMLEFREIASPRIIDFTAGCYVGYEVNGTVIPQYSRTGFSYKLYSVPQVKKQARPYSYGAAFVYQGVQFFDASKELELCPFRDLVTGDNRIHFSTQPSISTFEGCDGLARRFEACLREQYDEDDVQSWQVRIATTSDGVTQEFYNLMLDAREFTVSGVNILQCLDKIYEIWPEVGWVYTVETVSGRPTNTIIIGGAGLNANQGTYAYGKGRGLTSITRTVANADEMANRIYAYGSSRNMLPKWYNRQAIKDAQSVDIQNLMIPIAHWGTTPVSGSNLPDASKAYVENRDSIDRIGLRPKTAYFDGSGEYPEIYPSLRGKTIGNLWSVMSSSAQFYPSHAIYSSGDRIDTVLSAQETYDSGLAGNTPGKANVEMGDTPFYSSGSFEMLAGLTYYPFYHYQGTWTPDTAGIQTVAWKLDLSGQVQLDGIEKVVVSVDVKDPSYQGPIILANEYELTPDGSGIVTLSGMDMYAEKVNVSAVDYYVHVDVSVYMTAQETDKTGTYTANGNVGFALQNYRKKTFTISLRQIGFDINAQSALSDGKSISMRSGKCQGRTFTIKNVQYDSYNDAWNLECFRSEDESLSQWFPNSQYPVRGKENDYDGDEFVLLDIAMPELYVILAENELYQAALDLLSDTAVERWQYVPEIDAKYMVENSRTIRCGEYMAIIDPNIIIDGIDNFVYFRTSEGGYFLTINGERIIVDGGILTTVLVDTIVINEGEAAIPTYKVTLRDRKRKVWTESKGAEVPSSKSVGSITETQVSQSSSSSESKYFTLDENGNVTLKPQYSNLWVPGWMAAGGVGTGGGGGGVSFLKELGDVYHNDSNVLRANGTGVQPGDALVYDTTHGWVAAVQSGGISSVVLSAGSANGTLKLTVDGVAGSDVSVTGLGSFAYKNSLSASDIPTLSYLPLSGGELSGDLRLKGSSNYGRTLRFGDGDYAYIKEDTDDHFKIFASNGIELSTGSGHDVTVNGVPLDWFTVETIDNNPTLKLNPRYAGLWAEGWVAAGGAGSGSGGGGSTVQVTNYGSSGTGKIATISVDGVDTDIYNNVKWGTEASDHTIQVTINGTTKWLCVDGYSSGGGGGVSSVTLAEGTANGTLRLYVNGTAGSNVSVPGLGDLAFLDSLSASDIPDLSGKYVTLDTDQNNITGAKTFYNADVTLRSSDLLAYSNNSCDIGTSSKRFANIYGVKGNFSGNLTLSTASVLYVGRAQLSYDTNDSTLLLDGYDGETGYNIGLEIGASSFIDIGNARLEYDDGAKALHITYKRGSGQTIGVYADGFVAAGGVAGQSNINFVTTDSSEQTISGVKKFTNLKVTNLSAISSDIALSGTINGLTIVKEQGYISIRDASNRLYIQDNTRHLVLGGNSSSGCIYVGGYSGASGYKMYVQNGDVYFSDNAYASSWNTSSDRRLKENITTLSKDDAIEKIMALNPSVWQWNSGANKGMTASGFVAQEVESVIPFMVGGKEYKSLAYQMLHAYEISALQSHEERITALEKRLTD